MPLQYLIVVGLLEGFIFANIYRFFPLLSLSLCIVQVIFISKRFQKSWAVYFLCSIAITFAYGSLYMKSGKVTDLLKDRVYISVKTKGLPSHFIKKWYITEAEIKGPLRGADTRILLPFEVPPGSIIKGLLKVSHHWPRLSPGLSRSKGYITLRPERAVMYLPERPSLRWRLYRAIKGNFSPEVSELFLALTLGKRPSQDLYRDYSRAGLVHLLAISGTHFGFLAIFCFVAMRAILWCLPYKYLEQISKRVSLRSLTAVVVILVLTFYLYLSGGRVPSLRAYIMFVLFSLAFLLNRQAEWLYILGLSAVVVSFIGPEEVLGPSFLLSYTAVFFIGLTWQNLRTRMGTQVSWLKRWFMGYLLTTIAAFAGTAPLVVYFFHGLSLVGLVVNLLAVPFVSLLLLPGLFLWTVVFLLTGLPVFVPLLEALGRAFYQMVHQIAGLSFSYINIHHISLYSLISIYGAMVFGLLRRYILSGAFVALCMAIVIVSPSMCRPPMITFLDTGQAESAVVETDRTTLVIDTGRTGIETSAYLRYRGIDRIDLLLLSHSAEDHAGGTGRLLRDFRVSGLGVSFLEEPRGIAEKAPVLRLEAGDMLQFGQLRLLVLNPHRRSLPSKENDASLVLRVDTGGFSTLFTGDIEAGAEKTILSYPSYLHSDILKVAHHGSKSSSVPSFLRAVRPSVSIISVGKDNPYGHPHKSVLERLSKTLLLRTDRDGSIRACYEDGLLRLYRWKDFVLHPALADPEEEALNLWRLLIHW